MSYKCKICGMTANYRSGLKCYRCDTQEAEAAGYETTIYSSTPSYSDITDDTSSSSSSSFSDDGGDFGGGGASGSWDDN